MKRINVGKFLADNIVVVIVLALSLAAIPVSGYSLPYLAQELLIRLARNSFLVLALILPIMAGMGLNFGMVLGAMAGEIGLILVSDWNVTGIPGIVLASLIAIPISVLLGWISGLILNKAKGREMVASMFLGFFINGLYQFVVLYCMGSVIPISSGNLLLSRGYGIRNTVDLEVAGMRQVLDKLVPLEIAGISVPVFPFALIALMCLFILWFGKTKLGQDMRAVGQDMAVAEAAGIPVDWIRIVSIVISTVLACFGQIIFLQNMGTMNTYNSHDQTGLFAIAALLVGGASVSKARISNVFIGVSLFHLMFIVVPMAANRLTGQAQIGEFLSKFINYGIIALSLALYAWRRHRNAELARQGLRDEAAGEAEASI